MTSSATLTVNAPTSTSGGGGSLDELTLLSLGGMLLMRCLSLPIHKGKDGRYPTALS